MVRDLGDLLERCGERVEVVGHRVEIDGGDGAIPVPHVAGGEGRGVEETPEPLKGLPVGGVRKLGEEGVAKDGPYWSGRGRGA